MATMNSITSVAGPRRSTAITVAAVLYCWFGFAFIVSSVLIALYARRNGWLPVVFGIEMLAGPFADRFGVRGALAATIPWSIVNLLEMLTGFWLWKSRKRGGKLGIALFFAGMIFWIGYALPIMVVVGPLRVLLIAWGWKTLR
jgi:hypothetical protein